MYKLMIRSTGKMMFITFAYSCLTINGLTKPKIIRQKIVIVFPFIVSEKCKTFPFYLSRVNTFIGTTVQNFTQ